MQLHANHLEVPTIQRTVSTPTPIQNLESDKATASLPILMMRAYNFSSTLQKILGFQAAFRSTSPAPFSSFRSMSSATAQDPDINRTISYWFGGPEPEKRWFGGGPSVDAEIEDQFGELVEKARADELKSWTTEPIGTLALIILLDQFPRNIFRGTPGAFSSDTQALNIMTLAIAKGFDQQVPHSKQSFFYLPLMHDEHLLSQVALIALTKLALSRCEPGSELEKYWAQSLKFSYIHQTPILRFGRFPSRNAILGRVSTEEEIAYLKENPNGF